MSGPGQGDLFRALAGRFAFRGPGAHPPLPVLVVAVPHDEGKRRSKRAPMTKAGQHLDLVALDLLTRTAAVALLPAVEVCVDEVPIEHQPCGKTGKDRDERRAVRFACCCELQRHHAERTAARITSTGAGTPVHASNEAAPWATRTSSPSTTRAPAAPAARAVAVAGY